MIGVTASPSTRRCFVHIGLPKTGTSYLQGALWASRSTLARHGLVMLPATRRDHFLVSLALRDMLVETVDPPEAFTVLDRLAAEAAAVTAGKALLIMESLAPATTQEAARLVSILGGFEVHVIVTARDPARQLPSAWQQRMKNGLTHDYPEFLDAVVHRRPLSEDFWLNQDLPDVVERWSSQVPPERIHVVTVPPSGSDTELLLRRFCSVLDVAPETLSTRSGAANSSIGLVQAELLRRVNLALADELIDAAAPVRARYPRVRRSLLTHQALVPQRGIQARTPAALAPWCEQTASAWVEQLSHGGYDIVGDLEDLRPRPDAYAPDDQSVTAEQLVDSAAAALGSILKLRRDEEETLEELKGENSALRDTVRSLRKQLRTVRSRRKQVRPGPPQDVSTDNSDPATGRTLGGWLSRSRSASADTPSPERTDPS